MRAFVLSLAVALACADAPADRSVEGPPAERTAATAAEVPQDGAPVAAAHGAETPPTQVGPTMVERYELARRARRFDLPGRLDEISGLAFSPDGRLFAHDDERARVHQIDPWTGEVGKRFDLGETVVRGDFEGLAIVGERFFLVTSTGYLYEFREGADEDEMVYRVTDAGLDGSCEVEGLDYDPVVEALLLACKTVPAEPGTIVVHRLPLDPARDRPAPIRVPKAALVAHGLEAAFDPSGIAVDPAGTILLVAARQAALLEIDRTGAVVSAFALSSNRHPQAEGLAIGPDGTLYLADERNGGEARLTAYARAGPAGGRP